MTDEELKCLADKVSLYKKIIYGLISALILAVGWVVKQEVHISNNAEKLQHTEHRLNELESFKINVSYNLGEFENFKDILIVKFDLTGFNRPVLSTNN